MAVLTVSPRPRLASLRSVLRGYSRLKSGVPLVLLLGLVASLLTLSACSPSLSGEEGRARKLSQSCPVDAKQISYVALDASGSQQLDKVVAESLDVVEEAAFVSAVCSGYLRVAIFGPTGADTAILFDGDLTQTGGTDIARFRRVAGAAKEVRDLVDQARPEALTGLNRSGSGIIDQIPLAVDYFHGITGSSDSSSGNAPRLSLVIVTDGLDSTVPELLDEALTSEQAMQLASALPVPGLSGVSVELVGVGRAAGTEVSVSQLDVIKAFWTELLTAAGADSVRITTDFTRKG